MVLFSQPGQETAFARMEDLVFEERPSVVQHCRQIVYRSLGRRLRRHPENIDGNVTSFGRQFRVAQQFPASISRAVDYV